MKKRANLRTNKKQLNIIDFVFVYVIKQAKKIIKNFKTLHQASMEVSSILDCFQSTKMTPKPKYSNSKPKSPDPKAKSPIKVLDLFSGIGGFTLALKGITETIAFCELDWGCQKVLMRHHNARLVDEEYLVKKEERMKNKDSNPKFLTFESDGENINNKPPKQKGPLLFRDIHNITQKSIIKYPILDTVEMITAGFPCTDISVANFKGDGIDGNASGLFFEILRLVDLLPSLNYLFLENSPNIKHKGLESVVKHFKRRGFSCYWTYVKASDVGAYHKRKRWFCLCVREDVSGMKIIKGKVKNVSKFMNTPLCPYSALRPVPWKKNILNFEWEEDKSKPRILHKDSITRDKMREHMHRCRMLGNSIVPQAAAYAWNAILCHIFKHNFSDCSYHSNQLNSKNTRQEFVPSPPALFDNRIEIECSDGHKSFCKDRWVTPNYSFWHMFSGIRSARCNTTFTVQVYYDKNTHILEKNKSKSQVFNKYICNANFVEHLMGYPNDWTK